MEILESIKGTLHPLLEEENQLIIIFVITIKKKTACKTLPYPLQRTHLLFRRTELLNLGLKERFQQGSCL